MKLKQLLSGMLAGAMVLTSVLAGNWMVQADDSEPTPDYIYSFENDTDGATALYQREPGHVNNAMLDYEGEIVYDEGVEGKAIRLGNYGLKLNRMNIGTEYTVSMWLKPDEKIATDAPALFLGYHDPQKWLAVSGNEATASSCRFWGKNSILNWQPIVADFDIPAQEWTHIAITGDNGSATMFLNGVNIGSGASEDVLNGTNQDIYIGVSNWDEEFEGLVDEIKVYETALTDRQVYRLFDDTKTDEDIFEEEGFTVNSSVNIMPGTTYQLNISYSSAISDESVTKVFKGYDNEIIEVDGDGIITAKKLGITEITTELTVGSTTKSGTTEVNVIESHDTVVDYDMTVSGNYMVDQSGKGHDGTITGINNITFIEEDGEKVARFDRAGSYVALPLSIKDSMTDPEAITMSAVFARTASSTGTAWLFGLGSKVQQTGYNYFFFSPYFQGGETRSGIKSSGTDSEIRFDTVVLTNEIYYSADLVFDYGVMSLYIDGVKIDEIDTGYSMMDDVITPGTTGDVLGYIGRSVWSDDTQFIGKLKSFKIYDSALPESDIQAKNNDIFTSKFDAGFDETSILGSRNKDLDNIAYDLSLPETYSSVPLSLSSSHPEIITEDGKVYNADEDVQVTLTITVSQGSLHAERTFTVTVKALDNSELIELLEEIENMDLTYYTDITVEILNLAVETGKTARSQSEVDAAEKAVDAALNGLLYQEGFENPWPMIEAARPAATLTLEAGKLQQLFSLPAAAAPFVNVTYSSSDNSVVQYQDGVAKALKAGKATVYVVVKAKNGSAQTYQTVVTVPGTAKPDDPKKDIEGMDKVTAKPVKEKLAKGKSTTITVSYPATVKAANPSVTYKASGAVTVNKNGKVTAKKAGTGKVSVTVTIASTGQKVTETVSFKVGAINKTSVKKGKSVTLKVKGISGSAKWKITKGSKLARLSKAKGKSVKLKAGKKTGTITVTATVSGVKITRKIKIKK